MITRTRSKSVVFGHPFDLKGVDRTLPPGEYKVVTDEQLIEELSFPVYRRVATMIFVPANSPHTSSIEMVTIDPRDLQAAQERDGALPSLGNTKGGGMTGRYSNECPTTIGPAKPQK
jgi:hypothetical protein